MLEKVTLHGLADLDGGRLAAVFDLAVARIYKDLAERPGDGHPRKVTATFSFTPIRDPGGELESADVAWDLNERLPKSSSKRYNATAGRGGLFLNELSPEDARQLTLDEAARPRSVTDVG